jgi:prophage regulatory protein
VTATEAKQARDRVAEQNARDRAARGGSGLSPNRAPAATPREQRPDAMATAPPPRLLVNLNELSLLGINYSKAQLYKLMADGKFPRLIKTSTHRRAFLFSEIEAWLAKRVAERDAA